MKSVVCNTCKTEYKVIFSDTLQAERCAATIYLKDGEYYLTGYYGSQVADMRRYFLDKCVDYELGTICDDCISKLISKNIAHLIEDGIW